MTIDFGIWSRLTAWSLLITRSPSMLRPGSDLGRDPVATTRFLALIACPLFLTTTLCSDSITPSPCKTATLFFLSRNSVPRQSWLTTLSLRLSTAGQSICTPSVLMPSAAALWISCASSEEWRNDLVGMQPRCRQVPPTFSFSMTATLSPSWAPRIAPTYPAEPPPMTATSNASSGIRNDCTQPPTGHLTLQHRQRRGQLQVLGEVVRCVVDRILVLGAWQRHGLVRADPRLLDRVTVGRQPVGDRQVQVAVSVAQWEVFLNGALAEGLDADQLSPAMILDRAGGNLRSAGRVLVDQDHERVAERPPVAADTAHLVLSIARHQDGARPAIDEFTDDIVGRIDVTTRVVAQVEQDPADRTLEVGLERLVELGGRPAPEVVDPDVEHPVVENMGGDTGHVDLLAGQVEGQRLAVPVDLNSDLGAGLSPDMVDRVVGRPSGSALPVNPGDDVARLHASFFRRRAGKHAGDQDLVALLLH